MSLAIDLIRRAVPRSIRNELRRPRATAERVLAKLKHWMGQTAKATLAEGCEVKCHPICLGEFSVFTTQPEQICEMKSFVDRTTKGMRLMDVGAHWGSFSLAALHFGGPEAHVLAIEASDKAADIYSLNMRLNGNENRVTLINAACGDRSGKIPMLTTGAGGADYFVVPSGDRPDTIEVDQVSVDDVRKQHGFDPSHLKIDVEGYEEEVLRGAHHTLRELRPVVFIEVHGDLIRRRGKSPDIVLDLLVDAGYSHWEAVEGGPLDRASITTKGHNVRMMATPDH